MARIEDGTGRGFAAAVNSTNRLVVQAEAIPSLAIASAEREDAFIVTTGIQVSALAAAGETGLLYIQNLSPAPLAIGGIQASNDQAGVWRLYRQPTGGTLLSSTLITPQQLSFASSKPFVGVARRGVSGSTITGGSILALGRVPATFVDLPLQGAAILGTSDAIALSFDPDTTDSLITANVIVAYLA